MLLPRHKSALQNSITTAIGAILKASPFRTNTFQNIAVLIITMLCLLANPWKAKAHSPDVSSTMLVQQKDGSWILQIKAALTAFEFEIKVRYGENAFDTPEKFRELVLEHVLENLSIDFNLDECAHFQDGFVKLGHETSVVFKVIDLPETFNTITVKNGSFQHIFRNQSALIVLKKGMAKEQFILNKKNKHTATLEVKEAKFALKP